MKEMLNYLVKNIWSHWQIFHITFSPVYSLTSGHGRTQVGCRSFCTYMCICAKSRSCKYRSSPSIYVMRSVSDSDQYQMLQRKFPQNPRGKQPCKNGYRRTVSSWLCSLAGARPEEWHLTPFPSSLSPLTLIMYILFSEACLLLSVPHCKLPHHQGFNSLCTKDPWASSDTRAAQPLLRLQKGSCEAVQRQ